MCSLSLVRHLSAGLLAVMIVVPALGVDTAHAAAQLPGRPNVLFVLTDDLARDDLQVMPNTRRLIAGRGATFENYFVSSSACCPSRVTMLRGQYAHNTKVKSNGGTNGGFETAYRRHLERVTIATRLQHVGYRTGLFGKYLNGYPGTAGDTYVPPGWNDWASPVAGDPYGEFNYTLNENGALHTYGADRASYGTDVYVGLAAQFIEQSASEHKPFFAYLSVYAPHEPATPAPEDTGLFVGLQAPRTPGFDQPDVAAMPSFIQALPALSDAQIAGVDQLYRKRLQSLQAVDRGVATLVDTLRRTGQLKRTYIVFTSDNGFHLGQHRLPAGKLLAYDTDTHVPLLVRGPGVTPGTNVRALAGNIDLAPTFAAIADTRAPAFTDGRSLLGLLHKKPRASTPWRDAYLLEFWRVTGAASSSPGPTAATPTPLEPSDADEGGTLIGQVSDKNALNGIAHIPKYSALRTRRHLYVEYATGERELYDTRIDPDEIHNVHGNDPHLEHELARQLAHLRRCHANSCRSADRSTTT